MFHLHESKMVNLRKWCVCEEKGDTDGAGGEAAEIFGRREAGEEGQEEERGEIAGWDHDVVVVVVGRRLSTTRQKLVELIDYCAEKDSQK